VGAPHVTDKQEARAATGSVGVARRKRMDSARDGNRAEAPRNETFWFDNDPVMRYKRSCADLRPAKRRRVASSTARRKTCPLPQTPLLGPARKDADPPPGCDASPPSPMLPFPPLARSESAANVIPTEPQAQRTRSDPISDAEAAAAGHLNVQTGTRPATVHALLDVLRTFPPYTMVDLTVRRTDRPVCLDGAPVSISLWHGLSLATHLEHMLTRLFPCATVRRTVCVYCIQRPVLGIHLVTPGTVPPQLEHPTGTGKGLPRPHDDLTCHGGARATERQGPSMGIQGAVQMTGELVRDAPMACAVLGAHDRTQQSAQLLDAHEVLVETAFECASRAYATRGANAAAWTLASFVPTLAHDDPAIYGSGPSLFRSGPAVDTWRPSLSPLSLESVAPLEPKSASHALKPQEPLPMMGTRAPFSLFSPPPSPQISGVGLR